tara:strand:- start:607 stop:846 length:240 start_codon:yes stop_codon:yes gene_type:complete
MEGATVQQPTDGARISNEQINSLQVLIQAAQLSCKRGAFSLEEAESVSQAVKRFVVRKEEEASAEASTTEATDEAPKVI